MEWLLNIDEKLFFFINQTCHFRQLDALMPYWRSMFLWLPIYGFGAAYLVVNYGRRGWFLLLAIGLTVGLADLTSSQLLKKTIRRERPCNDANTAPHVKLLVRCGSGYSFTSSHATNHFALAYFLILSFFRSAKYRRFRYGLLGWAGSIGFGQVYVGVHYPLDVLCGGLVGCAIGWLGFYVYQYFGEKYQFKL